MRLIRVFTILLLGGFNVFSQEEFSFELYIEDAIGTRDTVVIGYDITSTDSIDVLFGEVNLIDSVWSKSLEARVGVNSNYCGNTNDPVCLSKKSISPRYPGTMEFWLNVSIYVRCDNYPIKFSWDETVFVADNTIVGTMIAGDCWSHYCSDVINSDYVKLSDIDSIQFMNVSSISPNLEFAFSENGHDIRKASFAFNDGSTYCGWGNVDEYQNNEISVFPNPTSDVLFFEYGDVKDYELDEIYISNVTGKRVLKVTNIKSPVEFMNIDQLPNGVYFIQWVSNNRILEIDRFVISK